jgi:prefoldin beta subunit
VHRKLTGLLGIQEFSILTPNNTIYKLIGTALVKQDQSEAKANVKKRLEFINGEMCVFLVDG